MLPTFAIANGPWSCQAAGVYQAMLKGNVQSTEWRPKSHQWCLCEGFLRPIKDWAQSWPEQLSDISSPLSALFRHGFCVTLNQQNIGIRVHRVQRKQDHLWVQSGYQYLAFPTSYFQDLQLDTAENLLDWYFGGSVSVPRWVSSENITKIVRLASSVRRK